MPYPPHPSFFPRLARPGPELSSGLTDRAKPISLKQVSNPPPRPLCVPTPAMCPLRPFSAPTPTTESQTKQKQSPFFIGVGTPGPTTLHGPPSTLLFRPGPHPGVCGPAAGPPCWGLSVAAANPDVQAARTSVWQTRSRGLFPVGQNQRGNAVGDSGGLSGVWAGWGGGYLKDSPVTHDPECGGRRWRAAAAWSPKPTVHSSIK